MNNVQSGITSETIMKELKAREKWKASYSKQFGLPLSDPGDEANETSLPGPIVRVRKPLPFSQAYVPSSYKPIDDSKTAGNGSGNGSGSGEVRHNAPYAYAESAVHVNPKGNFGASITRSGLKAAVAHGPVDPNAPVYVKGDNTVVAKPPNAYDAKHVVQPAGIKTRPPQQLLTHTKPGNTVTGSIAPDAKQKYAATTMHAGPAAQRAATPAGHGESLSGGAKANGQSAGAAPATPGPADAASPQTSPSAQQYYQPPQSASGQRPLSASVNGGAATGRSDLSASQSLSATQLSQYNPALRPPSATVTPAPNLAAQKAGQLYTALAFRVKNCEQRGVLVTAVDRFSSAEKSGLRVGDLCAYVNNRPTRNVDEFYAVVAHAQGTLHITARRRGFPKVPIVLKV